MELISWTGQLTHNLFPHTFLTETGITIVVAKRTGIISPKAFLGTFINWIPIIGFEVFSRSPFGRSLESYANDVDDIQSFNESLLAFYESTWADKNFSRFKGHLSVTVEPQHCQQYWQTLLIQIVLAMCGILISLILISISFPVSSRTIRYHLLGHDSPYQHSNCRICDLHIRVAQVSIEPWNS